jgi:hypothetical protein
VEPIAEESRVIAKRQYRGFALLAELSLAAGMLVGQIAAPSKEQTDDAAAFRGIHGPRGEYLKLRKTIEKKLPAREYDRAYGHTKFPSSGEEQTRKS